MSPKIVLDWAQVGLHCAMNTGLAMWLSPISRMPSIPKINFRGDLASCICRQSGEREEKEEMIERWYLPSIEFASQYPMATGLTALGLLSYESQCVSGRPTGMR